MCVFSSREFFPACLVFFLSAGSVLGTGLVKTHSCGSGPGSHHAGHANKTIFLLSPTLLAERVTPRVHLWERMVAGQAFSCTAGRSGNWNILSGRQFGRMYQRCESCLDRGSCITILKKLGKNLNNQR